MKKLILLFAIFFSVSLISNQTTANTVIETEKNTQLRYELRHIYLTSSNIGDTFSVPYSTSICGYSAAFERINNSFTFRITNEFVRGDVCTYQGSSQVVYRIHSVGDTE
ncbi:MAG: hypothetical protein E6772_02270 [Dysgonomonas sp.]|nr:hypothetical protein [Dysgonomonas sp.]